MKTTEKLDDIELKFNTIVKDIREGRCVPNALRHFFDRSREIDFRDTSEIKVEYYISRFLKGCIYQRKLTHFTARNSPKTENYTDNKRQVQEFLSEDFKTVQQPFWAKYKHELKDISPAYNANALKPKEIYNIIQEIKDEKEG